eukprot:Phypoly_transcript_15816.p1 GENE.Phypoly_transcript_15816~~Phypoly_transcript_15816.p1  ORF type:complete len:163 (+),score=5.56 Phypoly_transcript_15816:231-719(+)
MIFAHLCNTPLASMLDGQSLLALAQVNKQCNTYICHDAQFDASVWKEIAQKSSFSKISFLCWREKFLHKLHLQLRINKFESNKDQITHKKTTTVVSDTPTQRVTEIVQSSNYPSPSGYARYKKVTRTVRTCHGPECRGPLGIRCTAPPNYYHNVTQYLRKWA